MRQKEGIRKETTAVNPTSVLGREASGAFKGAAESWCVIQMLSRQKRSISVCPPFYEMEMSPERGKTLGENWIWYKMQCERMELCFLCFNGFYIHISTQWRKKTKDRLCPGDVWWKEEGCNEGVAMRYTHKVIHTFVHTKMVSYPMLLFFPVQKVIWLRWSHPVKCHFQCWPSEEKILDLWWPLLFILRCHRVMISIGLRLWLQIQILWNSHQSGLISEC